jgi:hypothetical protein
LLELIAFAEVSSAMRRTVLTTTVVAIVLLCELASSAQSATATRAYADRLNIAAFSLGPEAEAAFAAEAARMDRLCQHHEYECLTRNIQHTSVTLATVHEAPSADSRVVGHILAVVIVSADRFENFGSLTIELDFGPSGSNERLVWIATVGDWGYGILVHGVRTRRDWIQLSGRLFPKNAWVWRNSPGFSATVDALDGAILALDPLEASEQTAEDSSWRRAVTRSCE